MRSGQRGRSTSAVELTNVSPHGFWLLIGENERFVSFTEFPWFRDATISELANVELPSSHHLHWPDLDIDLAVDSLDHPERFPLVSAARPTSRLKPTAAVVRERGAGYRSRRKRTG
jgi:hypothetical protein